MVKVCFVGHDFTLKEAYCKYDTDCDFTMLRRGMLSAEQWEEHYDVLIISDREVPALDLMNFVKRWQVRQMFYLISNHPKTAVIENKIALCKQHELTAIMPRQTAEQIVQMLLGERGKSASLANVCAIMGTHPQVGVTTIALNVAAKLGEQQERSVCVIGCNPYNPGVLIMSPYKGSTFDEMYASIADQHRTVRADELLQYMHADERWHYHYLAGNQDFTKRNYFESAAVSEIIRAASEQFDLVILDAGASPCNNVTLQALMHAELKLLVGNQQMLSASHWQQMNANIFKLLGISQDEFLLVVNRYKLDLPMDRSKLEAMMNVPTIMTLADFGIEGELCELEHHLLIEMADKSNRRKCVSAFTALSDIIIKRMTNKHQHHVKKERTGLWRMLS